MIYYRVPIYTCSSFVEAWDPWINRVVLGKFKKNKNRIPDCSSSVKERLIKKDFIGRWFFKHLTDDLVDRSQAEEMLSSFSGKKVCLLSDSTLIHVVGNKTSDVDNFGYSLDTSLYRIKDVMNYINLETESFFYSPQGHTINSDKVIELLGLKPGNYNALKSLYLQGKLIPSEFTEHSQCSERGIVGKKHIKCAICEKGRLSLKNKRLSLDSRHDWEAEGSEAKKLRWNDNQLKSTMRHFRKPNKSRSTPLYIMRIDPRLGSDDFSTAPVFSDLNFYPENALSKEDKELFKKVGIIAGLLEYARTLISNAINNEFKKMRLTEDIENRVFNGGMSPELSMAGKIVTEYDEHGDIDHSSRSFVDFNSLNEFSQIEDAMDANELIDRCGFTDEEYNLIINIYAGDGELKLSDYAEHTGLTIQQVHKINNSAMSRLRWVSSSVKDKYELTLEHVADKYGICSGDVINGPRFGKFANARSEFFGILDKEDVSPEAISKAYDIDVEKVVISISRHKRMKLK